jgi:hypothetical protein
MAAKKIREITCLERTDLKPETLGLTLAEGKAILKGVTSHRCRRAGKHAFTCAAALPRLRGFRSLKGYP